MKSAQTARTVIETLAEQHPNADTELHYRNAFELLVATILSAQSTDQRVNLVTPALFARFPDAAALSRAPAPELERLVVSTGFFRQKSKALIGMAQKLVAEHHGEVPADMEKLTTLPGVGRKTANVVLGHALGIPGLPVDRHVLRVSNRIGIAEGDDPVAVEEQLCRRLPREMWTLASDVQILHGRRVCRPKPLCDQCSVREYCDYYRLVVSRERPAKSSAAGAASRARPKPDSTKAESTKRASAKPAATSNVRLKPGTTSSVGPQPDSGNRVRPRPDATKRGSTKAEFTPADSMKVRTAAATTAGRKDLSKRK
jgi:endonuclease III